MNMYCEYTLCYRLLMKPRWHTQTVKLSAFLRHVLDTECFRLDWFEAILQIPVWSADWLCLQCIVFSSIKLMLLWDSKSAQLSRWCELWKISMMQQQCEHFTKRAIVRHSSCMVNYSMYVGGRETSVHLPYFAWWKGRYLWSHTGHETPWRQVHLIWKNKIHRSECEEHVNVTPDCVHK